MRHPALQAMGFGSLPFPGLVLKESHDIYQENILQLKPETLILLTICQ